MKSFRLALFAHFTKFWYGIIETLAAVAFFIMFIVGWAFLERIFK